MKTRVRGILAYKAAGQPGYSWAAAVFSSWRANDGLARSTRAMTDLTSSDSPPDS